jgi:UDP-glucose 4-epimerase
MKIIILGGDGFIGSHLVEKLLTSNEHSITILNRTKNNFSKVHTNINYIFGDFNDIDILRKAIWSSDLVIHLISTTVPITSNLDPIYDVKANLIGTLNLLEEMNKQEIKKFIFLSSGGTIYGNPKYVPMDEEHPLNPINSYGIVKMSIEKYIKLYAKKYNFKYCIIRPSNPYGPRQRFDGMQGVISTFLYKSLKNEPVTVWGKGSEVRDYIYIDDLIDILNIIVNNELENSIYNVGYGEGYSVQDIIEKIERVVGKKLDIKYIKANVEMVKEVTLDITKIKKDFCWQPKTSLLSGIQKHFEWLKSLKGYNEKQ